MSTDYTLWLLKADCTAVCPWETGCGPAVILLPTPQELELIQMAACPSGLSVAGQCYLLDKLSTCSLPGGPVRRAHRVITAPISGTDGLQDDDPNLITNLQI
jgi:hypothetical protein